MKCFINQFYAGHHYIKDVNLWLPFSTRPWLFIFILSSSMSLQVTVYAQLDRVKNRPHRFEDPVHLINPSELDAWLRAVRDKTSNIEWYVMADRADVEYKDKPARDGRNLGRLTFRELYVVLDETEEWVQLSTFKTIAKGRTSSEDKKLGWVSKKEVMLWNQALKDKDTGILKKSYLLNKDSYYETAQSFDVERDKVEIFAGPGDRYPQIDMINTYGFYFVYKVENNYYLIGRESELGPSIVVTDIVGWVHDSRCSHWDSRICFEPNFQIAAFEERKNNPNRLGLRAFKSSKECREYITSGMHAANASWIDDPALRGGRITDVLRKENVKGEERLRWPGTILRIPLLGMPIGGSAAQAGLMFKTGLVADVVPFSLMQKGYEMDALTYGRAENTVKRITAQDGKFKVIFLIEANPEYETQVKRELPKMMSAIKDSLGNTADVLKFGAVIYRDLSEATPVQKIQPDEDVALLHNKVGAISFRNPNSIDAYNGTSLFEAIHEAGKMCNEDENNVFIFIGRNANYTTSRGEKAKSVDRNKAVSTLADLGVAIIAFSLVPDNDIDFSLAYELKTLGMAYATELYQAYSTYPIDQFPRINKPEFMLLLEGSAKSHSLESIAHIWIYDMGTSNPLPNKMSELSGSFINRARKLREFNSNALRSTILYGESANDAFISSGGWTAVGLSHMHKAFEGYSPKQLALLGDKKIKIYQELYVPYRIEGAKHPALSTVLFMPERELEEYTRDMERLQAILDQRVDAKTKAKNLADAYCDLYYRLIGESGRRRPDCSSVSLVELRKRVHGASVLQDVSIQDFFFGASWGLTPQATIQDIRTLPDERLKVISEKVSEVVQYLNFGVMNNHDFMYESGKTINGTPIKYYWIPIKDAF